MSAIDRLLDICQQVWPPLSEGRPAVEVLAQESAEATVVSIAQADSSSPSIVVRAEGDAALLYIDDHGPMEFILLSDKDESGTLTSILVAARDGRLRAVGWRDSEGAFQAQRFETLRPDGSIEEQLYPPVEIPRRSRGKPDVVQSFEPLR